MYLGAVAAMLQTAYMYLAGLSCALGMDGWLLSNPIAGMYERGGGELAALLPITLGRVLNGRVGLVEVIAAAAAVRRRSNLERSNNVGQRSSLTSHEAYIRCQVCPILTTYWTPAGPWANIT